MPGTWQNGGCAKPCRECLVARGTRSLARAGTPQCTVNEPYKRWSNKRWRMPNRDRTRRHDQTGSQEKPERSEPAAGMSKSLRTQNLEMESPLSFPATLESELGKVNVFSARLRQAPLSRTVSRILPMVKVSRSPPLRTEVRHAAVNSRGSIFCSGPLVRGAQANLCNLPRSATPTRYRGYPWSYAEEISPAPVALRSRRKGRHPRPGSASETFRFFPHPFP